MIQVAGVNVSPQHLRGLFLGIEGVAEVAIRPGGLRLKAFVVPAPGIAAEALEARLTAFTATLPAPARPSAITFGPALPRTPMGKLSDWNSDAALAD